MDAISLSILGICLGHPDITTKEITGYPKNGVDSALEELDNVFDDYAYDRDWRPWEWEPGECINCCHVLVRDQDGACVDCGWLQGGN